MNIRRSTVALSILLLSLPSAAVAGGGNGAHHYARAQHHTQQARSLRLSNRTQSRAHVRSARLHQAKGLLWAAKSAAKPNATAIKKLQTAVKALERAKADHGPEGRNAARIGHKLMRDAYKMIRSAETALTTHKPAQLLDHNATPRSRTRPRSKTKRRRNRSRRLTKRSRQAIKRESSRLSLKGRSLVRNARTLDKKAQRLAVEAKQTGNTELATKSQALWSESARLRAKGYSAQAEGLRLAADASTPARRKQLRQRAKKLERKAKNIKAQRAAVIEKNPHLKSAEALKTASAALGNEHNGGSNNSNASDPHHTGGTQQHADGTHHAGDNTHQSQPNADQKLLTDQRAKQQAADAENPAVLDKNPSTKDSAHSDAHQQHAQRPQVKGDYGKLKRFVRNKDLGNAFEVLKALERDAGNAKGVKGVWKRFQVARARRKMRKAAVRLGKESLRNGTAGEYFKQSWYQNHQLRGWAQELLAQAGNDPQKVAEAQKQIQEVARNMDSQLATAIRQDPSSYRVARRVLRHLEHKRSKHGGLRKIVSGLTSLVLGSPRGSQRKLDKALISEARQLVKKGGVDGAVQAQLMLTEAKTRGLGKTWRYKRARNKAHRNLKGTIKKAIKSGDPEAVRNAYLLREAYEVDRKGNGYRMSERDAKRMEKDIGRAERNFVSVLAKQAEWMVKYPRMAEQMGYTPELIAQVSRLARAHASEAIKNGQGVSNKLLGRLDKVDKKLNAGKPGIIRRIATLPFKIAMLPLKAIKFFTVTQYRHLKYSKTGGVPPAPMEPARLQSVLEAYMPQQYQGGGGGGGGVAETAQRAQAQAAYDPADPYGQN